MIFHFQKSISRNNSGHEIVFSKNEKSEIRSKNSKKMLEFSLKMIISRFFLRSVYFKSACIHMGGCRQTPPYFRFFIFLFFHQLPSELTEMFQKIKKKHQNLTAPPPVTSPLDSWGGRSLLSIFPKLLLPTFSPVFFFQLFS